MKLNVEIDLSETFESDDYITNIEKDMNSQIVWEITRKLREMFTKKIEEEIERRVSVKIRTFIGTIIPDKVDTIVTENAKIEIYGKKYTIPEYIEETVKNNLTSYSYTIDKEIKKLADASVEEMKKRFDIEFARNIVLKMEEKNLLKDNALTQLLSDK